MSAVERPTPGPLLADDVAALRDARLYTLAQAFGGAAAPVTIALGALAGSFLLGPDKSLATLPVAAFNVGTAAGAVPAALATRRLGRRRGFALGAVIGMAGMVVAGWAILAHSFWLFALGTMLNGVSNGFTQQYRFAAADRGSPAFRPRAISMVLVGGIASAVIGPQLVIWTTGLTAPVPFAGAFLCAPVLFLVVIVILSQLQAPPPVGTDATQGAEPARPLWQIASQGRFLVALTCGIATYALMSFVMTAAPLAMTGAGHSHSDSTLGIQWHVLAMFVPSLFTGRLIARYGEGAVIGAGLAILLLCAATFHAGVSLGHFWGGLVLLGIGWNFGFVGATALAARCWTPGERNKAQGLHDLLLFGAVAVSSLSSGAVYNGWGWGTVYSVTLAAVAIAASALLADRLVASRAGKAQTGA